MAEYNDEEVAKWQRLIDEQKTELAALRAEIAEAKASDQSASTVQSLQTELATATAQLNAMSQKLSDLEAKALKAQEQPPTLPPQKSEEENLTPKKPPASAQTPPKRSRGAWF